MNLLKSVTLLNIVMVVTMSLSYGDTRQNELVGQWQRDGSQKDEVIEFFGNGTFIFWHRGQMGTYSLPDSGNSGRLEARVQGESDVAEYTIDGDTLVLVMVNSRRSRESYIRIPKNREHRLPALKIRDELIGKGMIKSAVCKKLWGTINSKVLVYAPDNVLVQNGSDPETNSTYWVHIRNLDRSSMRSGRADSAYCNVELLDQYVVLPNDIGKDRFYDHKFSYELMNRAHRVGSVFSTDWLGYKYWDYNYGRQSYYIRIIPTVWKFVSSRFRSTVFSPVYTELHIGTNVVTVTHEEHFKDSLRNYVVKEMEADARKVATERRTNEILRRRNEFARKNGVHAWPSSQELYTNPFTYEGDVVAIRVWLITMQSATEALFDATKGAFLVSKVPKGMFKVKGEAVILAARVLGKTYVQGPQGQGQIQVTHLDFVDASFCESRSCDNMLGK